eukprot:gene6677-4052_t
MACGEEGEGLAAGCGCGGDAYCFVYADAAGAPATARRAPLLCDDDENWRRVRASDGRFRAFGTLQRFSGVDAFENLSLHAEHQRDARGPACRDGRRSTTQRRPPFARIRTLCAEVACRACRHADSAGRPPPRVRAVRVRPTDGDAEADGLRAAAETVAALEDEVTPHDPAAGVILFAWWSTALSVDPRFIAEYPQGAARLGTLWDPRDPARREAGVRRLAGMADAVERLLERRLGERLLGADAADYRAVLYSIHPRSASPQAPIAALPSRLLPAIILARGAAGHALLACIEHGSRTLHADADAADHSADFFMRRRGWAAGRGAVRAEHLTRRGRALREVAEGRSRFAAGANLWVLLRDAGGDYPLLFLDYTDDRLAASAFRAGGPPDPGLLQLDAEHSVLPMSAHDPYAVLRGGASVGEGCGYAFGTFGKHAAFHVGARRSALPASALRRSVEFRVGFLRSDELTEIGDAP